MEVNVFCLGPLETTCVLLHNGKEALVFDPGGNPQEVVDYLKTHGLTLTGIFNTHLHFDHTYGNASLSRATGAPVKASERDSYMLQSQLGQGGTYGLPQVDPYDFADIDEGWLELLGEKCKILATPGHSPGSLSYYFPGKGIVLSGDVLFYRSVGRSDFPGGDGQTLLKTIREKLYALPEATVVYAGHGLKTTIGAEKTENPFTL